MVITHIHCAYLFLFRNKYNVKMPSLRKTESNAQDQDVNTETSREDRTSEPMKRTGSVDQISSDPPQKASMEESHFSVLREPLLDT